jgi:hypothetical protein
MVSHERHFIEHHRARTMSNFFKIIATMLVLVLASCNAQATEATVISLSCDGTITSGGRDEKQSVQGMGLVVNFAEHTVSGFDVVAHIDRTDDASVSFSGESSAPLGGSSVVRGDIDRVTGAAWAKTTLVKDQRIIASHNWDLVCKVTNRVF